MALSKSFESRYGPWALVAGASEGLGAAFARELAQGGFNVVAVARREEKLKAFCAELAQETGREIQLV